jgi:two-component system sensor histidine kinase QseC
VKSIRIFLVVVLMATIALTVFLSSLHGYRSSMAGVQQLFDSELADRAHLLITVVDEGAIPGSVVQVSDKYAFQLWHNGELILRSNNTPVTAIAAFENGYYNTNFGQHRWRTYTWQDAANSGRWAIAAEQLDARNALAEKVILESVLPVITALPITGLLIWFVVGYGLTPLRRLAGHLRNRHANDLAPLPLERQPVELMQLVTSTNELLHRLQASFNREKRFASDAAHELRTPLSALKVHLHNITRQLPAADPELQQLVAATGRMENLIEQILSLYRTAPDQYMARFDELELYQLVQEVMASAYRNFEHKNIQLELRGDTTRMAGDRFALTTLVQNLLDNACKYTPPGGCVRVTLSTDKNSVTLQFEDSGPGIPAELRARVFDRFYRLHGDQHESGVVGCGLGLAIVKHIAELHSATVQLGVSSFGSGLLVSVVFPRSTPTAGNQTAVNGSESS